MSCCHPDVRPVAGGNGARIGAPRLPSIPDAGFAELSTAPGENQVVFLRGQPMTPAQVTAFTGNLGPLCRVSHACRERDGYPEVLEVVDSGRSGNPRHVGASRNFVVPFLEPPPAPCVLPEKRVTPHGGDTWSASPAAAIGALSGELRAAPDCLASAHAAARIAGSRPVGGYTCGARPPIDQMEGEVVDPLARTHPGSGRRCLFVNRSKIPRFVVRTGVESAVLHDILLDHATRSGSTCRSRWSPGAGSTRDNRCTQHFAIDELGPGGRVMHRTSVEGD